MLIRHTTRLWKWSSENFLLDTDCWPYIWYQFQHMCSLYICSSCGQFYYQLEWLSFIFGINRLHIVSGIPTSIRCVRYFDKFVAVLHHDYGRGYQIACIIYLPIDNGFKSPNNIMESSYFLIKSMFTSFLCHFSKEIISSITLLC